MRRTKIVCTIGPASRSAETLESLAKAGMNVIRLNASHGTHAEHKEVIERVSKLSEKISLPLPILLDLGGAKIRIGPIAEKSVVIHRDDAFTLTTRDVPGGENEVSLSYKKLPSEVQVGDVLMLADGALQLVVEQTSSEDIRTRVVMGGRLSSHKGINLPTRTISAPTLTEKDKKDLAFGLAAGVDYVSLSFVRSARDVTEARKLITSAGYKTPLVAKIEKHEALVNFDEILEAVDAIMIARGDLGVEVPIENVAKIQKDLIGRANRAGKPVITATQMLLSMVDQSRPTRAEATDVANAVLDGTDAVMLSEETAMGSNPVGAVRMMNQIAESAESIYPFGRELMSTGDSEDHQRYHAVAESACRIAERIGAKAIVAFTQSGSTAVLISRQRPRPAILAPTPDKSTYRQLALAWGITPAIGTARDNVLELEEQACNLARDSGLVGGGDSVVITAGIPLNVTGTTNVIKIAKVRE